MKITLSYFLIAIIIFCFNSGFCPFILAEESERDIALEPIVITATKVPVNVWQSGRGISVIDSDEIQSGFYHSVEEILDYALGVDMQSRGPYGTQADIGIRGSTYSQVLVLVNGVRVNDPQTGHYNLDLGLTLDSIERIEVLRGHGSSLHGPDAFGGVINIITKKPEKRGGFGMVSFGEHDTLLTALGFSQRFHKFGNSFSWEKRKSDGYRYDTDFDMDTFSSISTLILPDLGTLDWVLGYADKEFGANEFYAAYPSFEWTDTVFTSIGGHIEGGIDLEPKIYYRRHKDKYVLDITNPGWYVNYHTTQVYGAELHSSITQDSGYIVLGGEVEGTDIDSSNLGLHSMSRGAIFIEKEISFGDNFVVNLGNRVDYFSKFDGEWSPSLTGKYALTSSSKLRFSLGRCFRLPSFTELYYETATNIGNSCLEPEVAWSYEAGIDYVPKAGFYLGATMFWRDEDELIDWLALKGAKGGTVTNPWIARNVGEVGIRGIEFILAKVLTKNIEFSTDYTFIDSDDEIPAGYISKYALGHPRHHLRSKIDFNLPFGVQSLRATYKERIRGGSSVLVDVRLSRKLAKGELFLKITNLFNHDYEELQGIPMPGRWVQLGITHPF